MKEIEEVIKAQGGSVDLQELTECMNYAQNYKDVTKSPMQELMKIEEASKKSSTASVNPLDASNALITVDKLND